jgi:hypothetical protein
MDEVQNKESSNVIPLPKTFGEDNTFTGCMPWIITLDCNSVITRLIVREDFTVIRITQCDGMNGIQLDMMTGFCEHCDEHSEPVKAENFLANCSLNTVPRSYLLRLVKSMATCTLFISSALHFNMK